jgi:PIN domain nuclease of toxin-antitoxin system
MTAVVLDASAVLAVYFDEPGGEQVVRTLPGALLSAVNYSELIGKCLDRGEPIDHAVRKLAALGFQIVVHDAALARRAGELRLPTKRHGLSLADRACLALAERKNASVLTADRQWATLDLGIDVRLIR